MGVYGTTGRLEKAYRLFGAELDLDYTVVEADMAPAKVKDADFIGRAAVVAAMAEAPVARLCTLTVDDHASKSGERRYMLGRQPIVTPDGTPITDAKGRRSYATSAGAGPSLGKHILLAYLPSDLAVEGSRLAVEYFQELYPVTVSVVGARAPFDPENLRIRG
jgi:glycine cleavage system aminomethyltransferase T